MANWSQSHFLQSLGWAILNSFWQMAFLWSFYLLASYLFPLKANKRYGLAAASVFTGFAWFVLSFLFFFTTKQETHWAFFNQTVDQNNQVLQYFLLAASVTYLALLLFPSYRLFQNWQFVQKIKKEGLHKADLSSRLFVQKVAAHIGISKKVSVHVSDLVNSPLTIGCLKPVILLPLAACNNLSTQQVEAVLLHELSHIRRYDYIINFALSVIHTLLYFNPFVKQFINVIERERETCCDELVLQFGYDKVGYASALLTLEKIAIRPAALALAATGKDSLIHRIENIVGIKRKKLVKRTQLAGMIAALFCIIAFNSVMIIKEKKAAVNSISLDYIGNPFALFQQDETGKSSDYRNNAIDTKRGDIASHKTEGLPRKIAGLVENAMVLPVGTPVLEEVPAGFIQVNSDDVENSLTREQKEEVSKAVTTTKKVMSNLQWKEVENQIADAMTEKEKAIAQKEYNQELENLNWKGIEQNLKAQYEKIDWNSLNNKLAQAETTMKIDSLQQNYQSVLSVLSATERAIAGQKKTACTPIPDASVCELKKAKEEIKTRVEVLKALRTNKKVVRL